MTGKSKEERKDKKRRIIMGHHRTIPKTADYGVTKDEFFTILEKASQPKVDESKK